MTIQVNSGGVTVNGTISAVNSIAIPSSTQSIITITGTGNGAEQDAYTVSASKVFYLFGVYSGSASATVEVRNNAGTQILDVTSDTQTCGIVSAVPIAKWTAAQVVHVFATNGKLYTLWGIEQ